MCLRGTTDYWVNDALGQPFFAVERPIDHGLLEALRSDIVPRLLKDVPGQPTVEELKADRYRARFVILFDREGYSPEFFKEMWQTHRIACITYHKYPKNDWPAAEFAEIETTLPGGERVWLQLAERGTWIGDKKSGLWVREVRKLTPSGHQVSLISTAYGELALQDAAQLFSRWSQENFLRYMMQHYAIDLLNEYRTEEIPETKRPLVNPQWRELDRQRRSVKSKLTHHQARFAALTLHPQSDEAAQSKWEKRKAELVEAIEQFDHELTGINSQLKTTPSHLDWDKLPETEKFQRLAPSRKQLVDTVKLIAYRAETALAAIVREELARTDDARSLLRDLFCSEADLLPDLEQRVLRVQVHPMSNPRANRADRTLAGTSQRGPVHLSRHQAATRVLDRRRSRDPELGSTTESHRSGGLKLWNKTEFYVVAYSHQGCHRTSNAVDRPMNRLCRLMYANRGLHGHQGSSELRLRGWALLLNFRPYAPRSNQPRTHDSPAHRLNGKRYHEHWLHNLMASTSLMGFRNRQPAIR